MPTITTAQIKSTLQSAKQSAANKLHSAGQSTKDALKKAAEQPAMRETDSFYLSLKIIKDRVQALMTLSGRQMNWELKSSMMKRMARRLLNRYSAQQRNSLASPNGSDYLCTTIRQITAKVSKSG